MDAIGPDGTTERGAEALGTTEAETGAEDVAVVEMPEPRVRLLISLTFLSWQGIVLLWLTESSIVSYVAFNVRIATSQSASEEDQVR